MENILTGRMASFEAVKNLNLEMARAWGIKEVLRSFWLCDTVGKARKYFTQWYDWAIRSHLELFKKVARMCKARLPNL
jgi:transposase